jgi:hypothetical protein
MTTKEIKQFEVEAERSAKDKLPKDVTLEVEVMSRYFKVHPAVCVRFFRKGVHTTATDESELDMFEALTKSIKKDFKKAYLNE